MPEGVVGAVPGVEAGLAAGFVPSILANANKAKTVDSSPRRKMSLACSAVSCGPSIASSDGFSKVSVPVAMAT